LLVVIPAEDATGNNVGEELITTLGVSKPA
jgi:hypothetical protein